MKTLPLNEITSTFNEFLNEHGMWSSFTQFIEDRGYKIEEFGMSED